MTDLNYDDPSYLDLEHEVRELRGAVDYLRPRYSAMLAALKEVLEWIDESMEHGFNYARCQKMADSIEAAIAKAEGAQL